MDQTVHQRGPSDLLGQLLMPDLQLHVDQKTSPSLVAPDVLQTDSGFSLSFVSESFRCVQLKFHRYDLKYPEFVVTFIRRLLLLVFRYRPDVKEDLHVFPPQPGHVLQMW